MYNMLNEKRGGSIVKKYKLYKENILAKTMDNAGGFNSILVGKHNFHKINLGAIALDVGALVTKYVTDNANSMFLNSIMFASGGVIFTVFSFVLSDLRRIKNAREKLDNLELVLKEKGLDVDFTFFSYDSNGHVYFPSNDGSEIIYVDENQIEFHDVKTDKCTNITDEVNEYLMSKRQFRKYRKRISKN